MFEQVRDILAAQFELDAESISMETSLIDDLGADSLDVVELTMALEEEFSLPDTPEEELSSIVTVGDLANYVASVVG